MHNQAATDSAPTLVGPVPIAFTQGDRIKADFSTVTAAFYHHAVSRPDVTAARDLSAQPTDITYGDLARRANQLSRKLTTLGVKPGDRVPLVVKRGIDMLVGLVAILSCGAQYVPLDGGVVPDSTLRFVLEQAGGKHVLCLKSTKHRFETLDSGSCEILVIDEEQEKGKETSQALSFQDLAEPDHGCYVIYTSGNVASILIDQSRPIKLTDCVSRNYWDPQGSGCHPQKCNQSCMPFTRKSGHLDRNPGGSGAEH